MTATISKWGNSQGIKLPKDILKDLHLAIGDTVNNVIESNRLIIEPIKKEKHTYNISELVAKIPSSYTVSEEITPYIGKKER